MVNSQKRAGIVDRFECYLLTNPEGRFSHDEAHGITTLCSANV